jgi:hypothetical protein
MKLDEQFFQSLLSAAFTIQEYNDREFSASAITQTDKAAELGSCAPSIVTSDLEGNEREGGAGEKTENNTEPSDGRLKQADWGTSDFYLNLLNSIEVEEAELAETKIDPTNEDAKVTGRPNEHATADGNFELLRILIAEESDEKEVGAMLNTCPQEAEAADLQENDKTERQVSRAQQDSDCNLEHPKFEVCDSQIDGHLLGLVLQQVLQATRATTAAVALGHQGKLTCRDSVGESAIEIRAMIDTGSGFTEVCASKGTMQFCPNTMLDHRADAQACYKFGARAVIFMPFFHKDQLLGLIAALSRRPYAFGVRELQALENLVNTFTPNLQICGPPNRVPARNAIP